MTTPAAGIDQTTHREASEEPFLDLARRVAREFFGAQGERPFAIRYWNGFTEHGVGGSPPPLSSRPRSGRPSRRQRLTMVWLKAPDGHMTGTVVHASGAKYPVNVVWSSDTAFIWESAPHKSPFLGTNVVTHSLVHFKAHALEGTLEARPTTYRGRTLTGHFSVTRTS